MICYDNNIIENVRATTLLGANIIFMPHVTMCTPSPRPGVGFVDPQLWKNRETDPTSLRLEFDGMKGRDWLMKWLPSRSYDNAVYTVFSNPIGMDGGGLDRMDTKTGVFTHYVHNPADTNSITNNKAVSIFENQPNDLWIGNWNNGGINWLNVKTGNFKHYLLQSNITSILKDAEGTTWAGTENGLLRYDSKTDEFYRMNEENTGLDITNVV